MVGAVSSEQPRPHHYLFANGLLRRMAHRDPAGLMRALAAPGSRIFLSTLWNDLGAELAMEQRLVPVGLRGALQDLAPGRRLAVIVLPLPQRPTEAYFVGIVVEPLPRRLGLFGPRARVEYFLLNLHRNLKGEESTRICSWEMDGKFERSEHSNLGDGPPPNEAAFLEAVVREIA